MKNILFSLFLLSSCLSFGQVDTSQSTITFSGYAEVYYQFDFNAPSDHARPGFLYSHPRHNEFGLNLGFIKAAYSTDRLRSNLSLATGNYMNVNYAAEPGVLKNIYEANAGVKISKKKNLWIDGGIFASHIGFESAISKDCWTLTRSIPAENTPYYESGAKLTFISDNNKWLLSGLILNGWQHIQRPDQNNTPAFGTQITFTPNSNVTLNYSTFIGNDKPDTDIRMRIFHDVYGIFHLTSKWHIAAGIDYGFEQKTEGSTEYLQWYGPVVLMKIDLSKQWSITGRGEYYVDKDGVIVASGTPNGFQTSGVSLNLDCKIRDNAVWRLEGRTLNSKDKIFTDANSKKSNSDVFVTTSLAVSF